MKKYVAICATLAALAWVGVAAADTPQGKLQGSGTLVLIGTLGTFDVIDGGTSYVGAENDLSGTCTDDIGTVQFGPAFPLRVLCAHYVASSKCCNAGSPKMRFAFQLSDDDYRVVRVTDNAGSTDTVAIGQTDTLANATAWVNRGAKGSGAGVSWDWWDVTAGGYTITASQT
jgi:hypothetical protein